MTKWYLKWKLTQQYWSLSGAERLKIGIHTLEMVNADIKAGLIKEWGITTDTGGGFTISDADITQLYEALIKYRPYISFEVTPVIPFNQHYETLKKLAASVQSK